MKQFERNLKYLISKSDNGCLPVELSRADIPESEARILKAKKLISLRPAGDNSFYAVIEDSGLTYFDDKRQKRKDFITDHIIRFIGGFISGVLTTVLAAWLIQQWL